MKTPKGSIASTAANAATKVGMILTPEQIAAGGSEHAHQAAIFQWIAIEGRNELRDVDMLFAVPNGGSRTPSVAAAMRAEGVKPGVPDMVLPVPIHYYGLYIELKVPGRERTRNGGRDDEQVKWHKRLRAMGYAVVTAYGWHAAVGTLRAYYASALPQQLGMMTGAVDDALPVVACVEQCDGFEGVMCSAIMGPGDVRVIDSFTRANGRMI
jgi:hypothetical protein